MQKLLEFFVPSNFMPHGHCYMWTPELLWLNVISNGLIAAAYFTIPVAIVHFIRMRPDLQFNWVFKMFSIFIFACGITHLISILTIWYPAYWLSASMLSVTAVASVITSVMLWRLMPHALGIISYKHLSRLQKEVIQRKEAETKLQIEKDSASEMAEKMTYLAEHDFLTGLPNRVLLTDRINQSIALAKRNKFKLAVMYLDVDDFKKVNDTLGHKNGDELLQILSKEIKACLREGDTVSRQGGDEFVVLLSEFRDNLVPMKIANKILEKVNNAYKLGKHETNISASIGIAIYPDDGKSSDELLKHADAAMYSAKNYGKNNYQFFTKQLDEKLAEQVSIEKDLLKAINRNEFSLHYQPKVSLKTGKIVGAEALIRWRRADGKFVPPDVFIPIAESIGLIKNIGQWVLNEACTQNKAWQETGVPLVSVAINVSVKELNHTNYLQQVSDVLVKTGLEARWLGLEVTETVSIDGDEDAIKELIALKKMGVNLSIDDFGTGYSSLSYLKRLPVHEVKIDKSFVRDIKVDADDEAIVTAIIKMSHSLNFIVVAEGVETKEQLSFLKQFNCDVVQGYYIGKPMPSEAFKKLLQEQTTYDI